MTQLAYLYNIWRDLGAYLDDAQPGLTRALPDDSPDLVDAMKVIYVADQLRRTK